MVISGGAAKVLSVIGILRYLEEHDAVKNIRNIVGTSAGALMSLFITLGYNSYEIESFLTKVFSNDDVTRLDIDEIFKCIETYGIFSGDIINKITSAAIYTKFKKKDITFIDLAKLSGKNLIVCVANLTKEKAEYYSVDTVPNLSIVTAIRASCSLPFVFTPCVIEEDIVVDGGLYDPFPIGYFKDHMLKDILGINILCKNYQNTNTFLNYARFLLTSLIQKMNTNTDTKDKNVVTLVLEESEWFNIFEMKIHITQTDIQEAIKYGHDVMEKQFKKDSYQQT